MSIHRVILCYTRVETVFKVRSELIVSEASTWQQQNIFCLFLPEIFRFEQDMDHFEFEIGL